MCSLCTSVQKKHSFCDLPCSDVLKITDFSEIKLFCQTVETVSFERLLKIGAKHDLWHGGTA